MEMIWVVPELKGRALGTLICRNAKGNCWTTAFKNYYDEQVFDPISTLAKCATIELCQ